MVTDNIVCICYMQAESSFLPSPQTGLLSLRNYLELWEKSQGHGCESGGLLPERLES